MLNLLNVLIFKHLKLNKINASIIILSRFSSNRLPGKALKPLNGIPLLGHIINRFNFHFGDNWGLVATSTDNSDDEIFKYVIKQGIRCFRGSLENVAKRFLDAANELNSKYVVRITGDSIFIDQNIIEDLVNIANDGDFDLVSNRMYQTYPIGQTVEVIKTKSFELAYKKFNNSKHFEHVTSFFYESSNTEFKILHYKNPICTSRQISMAIDTKDDYKYANKVLRGLGNELVYTLNYQVILNEYKKYIYWEI